MHQTNTLSILIIYLSHILSLCNAAGNAAGELAYWVTGDEKDPIEPVESDQRQFWFQKPSWYAQYSAESTGLDNPESYETNAKLAAIHFNWLLDRMKDPTYPQHRHEWFIVAVMFDPISRWHFVSTVPKGKRAGVMRFPKKSKELAPKWWAQVSKDTGANSGNIWFHAEDGVYYNWESSEKKTISEDPNSHPYPRGSIVATYGYKVERGRVTRAPDRIPACKGRETKKSPSCQAIASELGVSFSEAIVGEEDVDVDDASGEDP